MDLQETNSSLPRRFSRLRRRRRHHSSQQHQPTARHLLQNYNTCTSVVGMARKSLTCKQPIVSLQECTDMHQSAVQMLELQQQSNTAVSSNSAEEHPKLPAQDAAFATKQEPSHHITSQPHFSFNAPPATSCPNHFHAQHSSSHPDWQSYALHQNPSPSSAPASTTQTPPLSCETAHNDNEQCPHEHANSCTPKHSFKSFFKKRILKKYKSWKESSSGDSSDDEMCSDDEEETFETYVREKEAFHREQEQLRLKQQKEYEHQLRLQQLLGHDTKNDQKALISSSNTFSQTTSSCHFDTCSSNTHHDDDDDDSENEELEIDDRPDSEEDEATFMERIRRLKIAQWDRNHTKEHVRQNFQNFSLKFHNQIQNAKQSMNNTNQHMRDMFHKQTQKMKSVVRDIENRLPKRGRGSHAEDDLEAEDMESAAHNQQYSDDTMQDSPPREQSSSSSNDNSTVKPHCAVSLFGSHIKQNGDIPADQSSSGTKSSRPFHFSVNWKPQFSFPKLPWSNTDDEAEQEMAVDSEKTAQPSRKSQVQSSSLSHPDSSNSATTPPKVQNDSNPWYQPIQNQKWDFKSASAPPNTLHVTRMRNTHQVHSAGAPPKSSHIFASHTAQQAPQQSTAPQQKMPSPNPQFLDKNKDIQFVFPQKPIIVLPPPSYQQCFPNGVPPNFQKGTSSNLQTQRPPTSLPENNPKSGHQPSDSQQHSFSFVQHAKNFALRHPLPTGIPSFQFAKRLDSSDSSTTFHRPVKFRKIHPSAQTASRISSTTAGEDESTQSGGRSFGFRKISKGNSLKLKTGVWSRDEHAAFLSGYKKFGRQWSKIATLIPSRSRRQIISHAQKFLRKEEKRKEGGTIEA